MRLLYKLSFTKMRKNIGRFLSVLFIVALGVGFFAGLRETTPDIETTLDNYYDEHNLMDFKIVSTGGLTEDDVTSLKELKNVEKVIPSYSVDVLISGEEIRVHAIEEEINNVALKEGRMPEKNNECIADSTKYQIGDTLTITKESIEGILTTKEYKVVGLADSPLYLSRQMGIASIGTGELESFIYVPRENFNYEYYTEIYLTAKGTQGEIAYEDSYEELANILLAELEELAPIRETKRYEEILEEATIEIRKIETEANEEIAKAEEELNNALQEINNGRTEIENAKTELNNTENALNKQEKNGLTEINNARTTWEQNYNLFIATLNNAGLTIDTLQSTLDALNSQIANIEEILNTLPEDDPNYATYKATLDSLNIEKANLETLITTKETLESSREEIDTNETNLKEQIASARKEIASARSEIESNEN